MNSGRFTIQSAIFSPGVTPRPMSPRARRSTPAEISAKDQRRPWKTSASRVPQRRAARSGREPRVYLGNQSLIEVPAVRVARLPSTGVGAFTRRPEIPSQWTGPIAPVDTGDTRTSVVPVVAMATPRRWHGRCCVSTYACAARVGDPGNGHCVESGCSSEGGRTTWRLLPRVSGRHRSQCSSGRSRAGQRRWRRQWRGQWLEGPPLEGASGAPPVAMQQAPAVARRSPRPAVSIVRRRQPNNSPPLHRGRPILRVE